VLVACVVSCSGGLRAETQAAQPVFMRVFGEAVQLDPTVGEAVKAGAPGERHYVDRNGDGRPDEVWFIDTAPRHLDSMRPLLVRVIDEDEDLETGHEPDMDSDLYVADWKADGTVDVVCDYTDADGDDDVDEMALYFPGRRGLTAWWGRDDGDDNLLWYDVGYTYSQSLCQVRSHFGGNESFCAFTIGENDAEWSARFENPFVFYDHDGDGITEEVVRISGQDQAVHNLRHSFDVDNDARADDPRDFDASISAHARDGLVFAPAEGEAISLRGIPAHAFLSYAVTPDFARRTVWGPTMLTWVENDHNVNEDSYAEPEERWEGVICPGTEGFAQIGGPHCGRFNKRFELALDPEAPFKVYYAATDQRIHLIGADRRWMDVDADRDRRAEMRYEYLDTDGNGHVDTWRVDIGADGVVDDEWRAVDTAAKELGWTWPEVNGIMGPLLSEAPARLFALDLRLMEALVKKGVAQPDMVWQLLDSGFDLEGIPTALRTKFLGSNECLRFYLDVLKDRLVVALRHSHEDAGFWTTFDGLRGAGDLDALRGAVEGAFGLSGPLAAFDAWRVEKLAKYARPRVAWAQDWVEPNIGWESERMAYRAYWGQFDFFGKKQPCLVTSTFGSGPSYHQELDWGMDALHVGSTGGCGGVTLYVDGVPYPVRSPEGKGPITWEKRLVSESSDEVVVELLARNVGPKDIPWTLRYECRALADRPDSPVTVTIEGDAGGKSLELGIGLTILPQEVFLFDAEAGVMGSWGVQEPAIGTVGLGVVFSRQAFVRCIDQPEEHQVVVAVEPNHPVTYHIHCDWLRGRRFPCCPAASNWLDTLRETARRAAL